MSLEKLRDKFYGCIAGTHIGSAMGAQVECWSHETIQKKYGIVDKFYSYEHYDNGWVREPGTTEDGVERQKLIITAIMEKGDRVTAEDIRKIWVRDIKPGAAGTISEPFEGTLLAMAKSGIPATDLGKYCDYAGLVSFGRSCHPVGLINAGDPDTAMRDVYENGQLYQTANSRGLMWACVTAISIAEACKPNATVDSVIGAVFDRCDKYWVLPELERELKRTESVKDFDELRKMWDPVYCNVGIPYWVSYANEIITKGFCIFKLVKGNPEDAIIWAVNMGRDTDCAGAVAGGIAGALSGGAGLRRDWIDRLEHATTLNVNTNSNRTMREHSDGLYNAFISRMKKELIFADSMEKYEFPNNMVQTVKQIH